MGVILLYPKKGGRVRYPLVDNLLHQVIFFSYLTVSFSHYAIPTSHITVLLSHWVVLLLFSHTWRFHPHIVQFQRYMWQLFLTLGSFLTFFSHLTVSSSHCAVPTSYVTVLLTFRESLTFDGSILTLCSSNIICDGCFFSHLVVPLFFFSYLAV